MRMNGKVALATSAVAVLGVLAACSDAATGPAASKTPKPSFAVTVPAVTLGQITVCKDGNVGGTFSVSRADVGGAHGGVSPATTSSPTIATGTCSVVAVDPSTVVEVGSNVTITENAAANTVQTITGCRFRAAGGVEADCTNFTANPRFINSYHGYVITYTNTFTPPPPPPSGCTFTKGWYRNNGSSTVTAVDGRTKEQAQTIFSATPGKPNGVTWEGGNDVLNLYQQLLAAILNGGLNGPQAVKTAIAAAQAGTGGTGLNITTNLTQTQVRDLIDTLSNFNEGLFPNWPHCAD
jgi:hypothetical protein